MSLSYQTVIHPLFRVKDINCMSRQGVSLADATWMCDAAGDDTYPDHAHARLVHERLVDGTMPPDGAWTPANLATYQQWMDDGFQP